MGRSVQRAAIPVALVAVVSLFAMAAPRVRAGARAEGPLARPGQPAPELRLPTADEHQLSLADLRGKVVLVDFWASWCQPCATAFPALDQLYRDMRDRGFAVLAVNVDERRDDAANFLADRPHAMPIVFDPRGVAPAAFGVTAMPTSFLIGRDGRVRYVHVGYTSKTIDAYRREIEVLLAESTGS